MRLSKIALFQTSYSNGDLSVTTHRILWSSKVQPEMVLDLSLVILLEEEASSGFMKSDKLVLHLSVPPPSESLFLFHFE